MRSKLFVPGSRPELFAKALASAAHALSFDLEDAVPEARKAEVDGWAGGLTASTSQPLHARRTGDASSESGPPLLCTAAIN